MRRQDHHPNRGRWLVAAGAGALILALGLQAEARGDQHYDSIVQLNGTAAGAYAEDTLEQGGRLVDTVKETMVLNRLGSRVSIEGTDTYYQDAQGRLLGGRFEASSSKDGAGTDLVVKGQTLELTSHSGGKTYVHAVPFQGVAIGPEGIRRIMRRIRSGAPEATYQTFVSTLGALAKVTLDFQGADALRTDGHAVQAFKYREAIAGLPDALTLWTDREGYTVQASQGTPFGPVTFVRGKLGAEVMAAGANLPAEVYERTVAVSNIRLPHARRLDAITLELTKKPGAEDGWPDFASASQRVISETPRRVVLRLTRADLADAVDAAPPTPDDVNPNALIQSDLPEIKAAALQAADGETDPWKAALKLQTWTSRHMTFDAGIAVAPASELVRDRHGTCLGYSILLASLARARGIPARIRMGYVYLEDMWGGHAWVEVYAGGRWTPLDATIYYPGVADPARIGATTETGASGTLGGVGELARLYGKVEVRTLGYRLGGAPADVTADAQDHSVNGDAYRNPWLGLQVEKSTGAAFSDLADHWPDNVVVAMKSESGRVSIHLVTTSPDVSLAEQVRGVLKNVPDAPTGPLETTRWMGAQAVQLRSPKMAMIAAEKDDQLWMAFASGPDAPAQLGRALPGISIDDLKAPAGGGS